MKPLIINEEAPRNIHGIKLNRKLMGLFLFGWLFLLGGIFFLIMIIIFFPKDEIGLVFFQVFSVLLLCGGTSFYFLRKYYKTKARRKEVLINGEAVKAKVLAQERVFNPLRSTKNYALLVTYEYQGEKEKHRIVSSAKKLFEDYQVGDELTGLLSPNGEVFFPIEAGWSLEWEKE